MQGFHSVLTGDDVEYFCNIKTAKTFLERARGLLFSPKLCANQGLWIERCSSIHTFGMIYPLDVLFVDINGVVIRVASNVKPFRFCICPGARSVVELTAGVAGKLGISNGQKLRLKRCSKK
jgi:uncharacterized protein